MPLGPSEAVLPHDHTKSEPHQAATKREVHTGGAKRGREKHTCCNTMNWMGSGWVCVAWIKMGE